MGANNTKPAKNGTPKGEKKTYHRKKANETSTLRDEKLFQVTNTNVANNQVQDKLKRIFKRRRSQSHNQTTGDEKIVDWLEKNKNNYRNVPQHLNYIPDFLKPNADGEEAIEDLSISQDSISSNVDMNNDNERPPELQFLRGKLQHRSRSQSFKPKSSFSFFKVFKWNSSKQNQDSTGDIECSFAGTTRNSQWTDLSHQKHTHNRVLHKTRGHFNKNKDFSRKRMQKRSLSTAVQQNSEMSMNHSRVKSTFTDFNKL